MISQGYLSSLALRSLVPRSDTQRRNTLGRISIIVEISSNFRPEKTAMDENGKPKDQTTVQGETKKTWTVMVYLAGDNNLTSNCITVLQQLEAVKYTKEVRVLACFDSNTPCFPRTCDTAAPPWAISWAAPSPGSSR
jgi:hypothetical protein